MVVTIRECYNLCINQGAFYPLGIDCSLTLGKRLSLYLLWDCTPLFLDLHLPLLEVCYYYVLASLSKIKKLKNKSCNHILHLLYHLHPPPPNVLEGPQPISTSNLLHRYVAVEQHTCTGNWAGEWAGAGRTRVGSVASPPSPLSMPEKLWSNKFYIISHLAPYTCTCLHTR